MESVGNEHGTGNERDDVIVRLARCLCDQCIAQSPTEYNDWHDLGQVQKGFFVEVATKFLMSSRSDVEHLYQIYGAP